MTRLISGSIAAVATVLLLLYAPVTVLVWVALALVVATGFELDSLAGGVASSRPRGVLVGVTALLGVVFALELTGVTAVGLPWLAALAVTVLVWVPAVTSTLISTTEQAFSAAGLMSFGALYLLAPFLAMVLVHRESALWTLLLCLVVWGGDAGAYYVGRSLGRRKLAPRLSPKKTWEGAIGGFVVAVVVTVVFTAMTELEGGLALYVVVALTSVTAQIGDLVASALKRAAGVKDSGAFLPGHGGFLDRIDGLLLAAPLFAVGLHLLARLGV